MKLFGRTLLIALSGVVAVLVTRSDCERVSLSRYFSGEDASGTTAVSEDAQTGFLENSGDDIDDSEGGSAFAQLRSSENGGFVPSDDSAGETGDDEDGGAFLETDRKYSDMSFLDQSDDEISFSD